MASEVVSVLLASSRLNGEKRKSKSSSLVFREGTGESDLTSCRPLAPMPCVRLENDIFTKHKGVVEAPMVEREGEWF